MAPALEPELGALGRAIAAYRQRRDLLRCACELAGAVAAVNCGFEQLERAAQDRVGFAAAVDRVAREVGRQARREQISLDGAEPKAVNLREQGLALWEKYSAGLPSDSLELRVAQRALRNGHSPKEIALVLVAGSETVRRIYESQGKQQAMKYATHIARMAVGQGIKQSSGVKVSKAQQIEWGD